jgi:prepilin-type N-terminal cleavage/methylation domain-containing protein
MKKKLKKGFTLVEMLVVVVIIGILSTVLYSSYKRYVNSTKSTVARAELMTIVQCFETAMVDNSRTGYKDGDINPESFTNFDELFELDLVTTYNYISEIKLPLSVELSVTDKDMIKYVDTSDGVEVIYDPVQRSVVSVIIY